MRTKELRAVQETDVVVLGFTVVTRAGKELQAVQLSIEGETMTLATGDNATITLDSHNDPALGRRQAKTKVRFR